MTSTILLDVGARVVVDNPNYPGVWEIEKVNPTRYRLRPLDGGRGLVAPHSMVRLAHGDPLASAVPALAPYFHAGTLVRWENAPQKAGGTLFVVTAHKQLVNIVKLGGDGGRYWRVGATALVVVDPADVIKD
jgi:hypothetical protein